MISENWDRRVWRLAGPIVLANISVPLLGAVDTAVMGHLPGPHYIGGVAIGAVIFSFVYWGFGFLRMGTTGLTAQAFGADDGTEVRTVFGRALWIAGALGIAIIALQDPIRQIAFPLIDASETVTPLAMSYFDIRIWAAPAVLANYAILGWLLGTQHARSGLLIQVFMNGANIALDLLFVMGMGYGVEGVALATVISEISAVVLGLWLVVRNARSLNGTWPAALEPENLFDRQRVRQLVAVNGNIFIRTLCLLSAFAIFTTIGARQNDVVLAANAVLLNFQTIMSYALDGFAHAAEALTGGAVGAKDRERFRGAVRATFKWAFVFAVVFAIAFAVGGGLLIDGLTNDAIVRDMARTFLPWVVVSPLISVWSYQLDGIFIGATRTRELRNAMIISVAIYIASLSVLVPALGNHGLWLSLMILMLARLVTLAWQYPALERSVGEARP